LQFVIIQNEIFQDSNHLEEFIKYSFIHQIIYKQKNINKNDMEKTHIVPNFSFLVVSLLSTLFGNKHDKIWIEQLVKALEASVSEPSPLYHYICIVYNAFLYITQTKC
jgi:hypothetical protein